MNITFEISKFFMDQCIGTHSGHMANIPNNPVLQALLAAHGVQSAIVDQEKFVEFLEAVAKQLKKGTEF